MKAKKMVAMLMAALMVMSITGCGAKTTNEAPAESNTTVTEDNTTTTPAADTADDNTSDSTATESDDNSTKYADILEKARALSGAPCAEVDSVTDDGKIVIH